MSVACCPLQLPTINCILFTSLHINPRSQIKLMIIFYIYQPLLTSILFSSLLFNLRLSYFLLSMITLVSNLQVGSERTKFWCFILTSRGLLLLCCFSFRSCCRSIRSFCTYPIWCKTNPTLKNHKYHDSLWETMCFDY